jgi:hypothetical protein
VSCIRYAPPPITAAPTSAHSWQPTARSSGTPGLVTLGKSIYIAFSPLSILLVASLKLTPVLLVAWANTFDYHFLILSMFHYSLFN